MLGSIISVEDNIVKVRLSVDILDLDNLINKNVIFEDKHLLVGEVFGVIANTLSVLLIGEIKDNNFYYGDIIKPSFNSKCRIISKRELNIIYKTDSLDKILLGNSVIYDDYAINIDVNKFFASHFAVLGNTGSGKSYAVARIIQSIFYDAKRLPFKTNIFLFDAYGEYTKAFNNIGKNSSHINYKVVTTNTNDKTGELLKIPFWLLKTTDIALLLEANDINQIPVIEKALKLVCYFAKDEKLVIKQKNDIIARALLDIIFNGGAPAEIRNKVVSVLTKFNTSTLKLDTLLTQPGWSRTLKQCLYVEKNGKFADVEIVISYLESLLSDDFSLFLPDGSYKYGLEEFSKALEFALISEGIFNSDKVYDYANILKIRLNTLLNSEYAKYFSVDDFVTKEEFVKKLLTTKEGKKAQVVNFNINYIDDRFAKSLVKIYSRILFDYCTSLTKRASFPFHIILEEAHRYVQNDLDVSLFGYNIFERITKEGRKYGILLGMISQRPSEITQTAISQCSNFLMFKMFQQKDIDFVMSVVPNATDSIINKVKMLYPGVCLAFGNSFNMPVLVNVIKPNPEPYSENTNISQTWYV